MAQSGKHAPRRKTPKSRSEELAVRIKPFGPTAEELDRIAARVLAQQAVKTYLGRSRYRLLAIEALEPDDSAKSRRAPRSSRRFRATIYDDTNHRTVYAEGSFAGRGPSGAVGVFGPACRNRRGIRGSRAARIARSRSWHRNARSGDDALCTDATPGARSTARRPIAARNRGGSFARRPEVVTRFSASTSHRASCTGLPIAPRRAHAQMVPGYAEPRSTPISRRRSRHRRSGMRSR